MALCSDEMIMFDVRFGVLMYSAAETNHLTELIYFLVRERNALGKLVLDEFAKILAYIQNRSPQPRRWRSLTVA